MVPAWTTDWVGLPYSEIGRGPDSYDCLGLYIAINKERLGIDIPDSHCSTSQAIRRNAVTQNRKLYEQVDSPKEGDALLIQDRGHPLHVGYFITRQYMIHTQSSHGSTVERWSGPLWKSRVLGIYRYVG